MTPRRFLDRLFRRLSNEIDSSLFESAATAPAPAVAAPLPVPAVDDGFDPYAVMRASRRI